MITGIVVALSEELSTLISGRVAKGNVTALTHDILVAHAGAGPENARRAAATLIERGADRLISWGCAAALSPEAGPGDLIIADRLLSGEQPILNSDPAWNEHVRDLLQDQLNVRIGRLTASPHIVADSQDKRALFDRTSALALDMESYAVAACAEQSAHPWLVLRAIADPADMTLPPAVSYALNPSGEVEMSRLIRHLLRHPLQLPELIRLGNHFTRAKRSLKVTRASLDKIMEFENSNTEN